MILPGSGSTTSGAPPVGNAVAAAFDVTANGFKGDPDGHANPDSDGVCPGGVGPDGVGPGAVGPGAVGPVGPGGSAKPGSGGGGPGAVTPLVNSSVADRDAPGGLFDPGAVRGRGAAAGDLPV